MKLDNLKETNVDYQLISYQKKMKKIFSHDASDLPEECPVRNALANLFDKWSITIFFSLGHFKVMRFAALKKNLKGISPKVLSHTLKSLEQDGYLTRTVYSEVPIRVEYELTAQGVSFLGKLLDLVEWLNETMPVSIKEKYKIDEVLHQHPTSVSEK